MSFNEVHALATFTSSSSLIRQNPPLSITVSIFSKIDTSSKFPHKKLVADLVIGNPARRPSKVGTYSFPFFSPLAVSLNLTFSFIKFTTCLLFVFVPLYTTAL